MTEERHPQASSESAPRVFTVPPDVAFLPHLAAAVLKGDLPHPGAGAPGPEELPAWTLFVPTRRAARTLARAFLEAGGAAAMLLPRIRPLGDVDEEELLYGAQAMGAAEPSLPPAVPALEREFLLARLVLDWAARHPDLPLAATLAGSRAPAFALARSLAGLIDGFETEGVSLDAIARLFDLDVPRHREIVLDFLAIVRDRLPAELAARGMVGEKERRSLLIDAEAQRLAAAPPPHPVIAAGSTGSIPATARLLSVIARLPLGAVVLPGLDHDLDAESWEALGQQHPQFGLRQLLSAIGIGRENVTVLPGIARTSRGMARARLASEIMRPAETSERWAEAFRDTASLAAAVDGLRIVEAPDQRHEALAIALLMREVLETKGRTCALVTPDRALAVRVKGELCRWRIEVDDSAGEQLSATPAGQFALALLDAAAPAAGPAELMALLDHRHACFGAARGVTAEAARALDLLLRGQAGLAGHASILAATRGERPPPWERFGHPAQVNLSAEAFTAAAGLARRLEEGLGDLGGALGDPRPQPLDRFLALHVRTAEAAHASGGGDDGKSLWTGEDGEALAGLFLALLQNAHACPPLTGEDYRAVIAQMLARVPVRRQAVEHPRLAILGLLEARLVRPDVVILGGLAEGAWPGEAALDPWLNRPQRARIDLPLPERRIGLQAHDFVEAMCAPEAILTRAARRADAPVNPSRWLVRLKALLAALGREAGTLQGPWHAWAQRLDRPDRVRPVAWPKPSPPVEARPLALSVTRIDDLADDPYRIFARSILRLKPLDPLVKPAGAAERGSLFHEALANFVRSNPGPLGEDAGDRLMAEFDRLVARDIADPALTTMLRPRLERIAHWFIAEERRLRQGVERQFTEVEGRLEVTAGGRRYLLTGKADRIDIRADGKVRILDYKTGSLPSLKPGAKSYSRQLVLEAAMVASGAFEDIGARPVAELGYMALKGSATPGEWKPWSGDLAEAAAEAFRECRALLADFARPETPYIATDWSDDPALERDYGPLSRWREWGQARGRGGPEGD